MTLEAAGSSYIALKEAAEKTPDAIGLVFPQAKQRLSFKKWLDDSERLAFALRELGVRPGDRVALWSENRAEWAVSMVALAALGAIMVPVNTHFREEDLRYVMTHSDSSVILLSAQFRKNAYLEMTMRERSRLPGLKHVICFDNVSSPEVHSYQNLIAKDRGAFNATEVSRDLIGSIQYTSGTTGQPKGAELTFGGMMLNATLSAKRLGLNSADRWTSIIPLFHCAGCIMNLMGCLSVGACYVGISAFDAEQLMQIIESERCTALTGVPTSFLGMLQHPTRPRYDMSSLRVGTCGGADCDPAVLAKCAKEFPITGLVQVYGQTESGTLISLDTPESDLRWETSGMPLDGMEMRITDPENRNVVTDGEIGQIEVRGPTVMLGYHRNPSETAETIDSFGWLQTGDLGYLRPDGRLVMAGGRIRDMIIRGGENIYPVEIENLLRTHPAVAEVAVFGEPDGYYGEIVAACISLKQAVSSTALEAHLHGRIAGFKHPARYYSIDVWPMTSSGKIRKKELREAAKRGDLKLLS